MNVSVLTLNCWGLWLVSKDRVNRMRRIGEELQNGSLDVALLQEVFVRADAAMLASLAVRSGLKYSLYFHSGFLGGELLILSRWPIQYIRYHRYGAGGSPVRVWEGDFYAGKGAALACLASPAGPLHVYNTHLAANYGHTHLPGPRYRRHAGEDPPGGGSVLATDGNAAVRACQVLELAQFMTAHSSQESAGVVLGGDLNCRPDDLEAVLLRCALRQLSDTWRALHPDRPGATSNVFQHPTLPLERQRDPPARIDYLWTNLRPLQVELVRRESGGVQHFSDHLGVRAVLRCDGTAQSAAMQLPGDAGLTRAMQEEAGLFQAAHRLLLKGVHRYEDASRALTWTAALLWAPALLAALALSVWVAAAQHRVAGTVWMWATFLLVTLVPAALIPLQLALGLGFWGQASAMRLQADALRVALAAPLPAVA